MAVTSLMPRMNSRTLSTEPWGSPLAILLDRKSRREAEPRSNRSWRRFLAKDIMGSEIFFGQRKVNNSVPVNHLIWFLDVEGHGKEVMLDNKRNAVISIETDGVISCRAGSPKTTLKSREESQILEFPPELCIYSIFSLRILNKFHLWEIGQ